MPTKKASPASQTKGKSQASKSSLAEVSVGEVKMKRLTLDIPEPLHRAIKTKAVMDGVAMVDMLRELLEAQYGKK